MSDLHFYLAQYSGIFISVIFILGLLVGSFLNVVILRLPVMLDRCWRLDAHQVLQPDIAPPEPDERFDLAHPRSHCPRCGHAIRAWENIPLLSWLWLRGKCSACGKAIAARYPLIELATGLLSAAVAWHFGYGPATAAALFLTWSLVALAVIDFDTQLLPDDITLPLLWVGLLINVFGFFTSLQGAVIGAAAGYGVLWLVFQVFKLITGREGMGFGDFKLFGALGAWLGWQQLPFVLLFSSFLGAVVGITFIVFFGRDRQLPIPFGPFLCGAGWVALLWGDNILRYYLQIARF